jgi:hypothetical protein
MHLQQHPEQGYLEMGTAYQPDDPAGISFGIQFDDLDDGLDQPLRILFVVQKGITGLADSALLDAEIINALTDKDKTQADKDRSRSPGPELNHTEIGKGSQIRIKWKRHMDILGQPAETGCPVKK